LAAVGAAGARAAPAIGTGSPLGPAPGAATSVASPATAGRFYSVAATSWRNAWAVGLQSNNSLIMHWSANKAGVYKWRVSYTNRVGYFLGVAATSTRNAWAVGGTNWFSPSQTLADHWNGKKWTRVKTPTPGGTGLLNAVAATSASNAWAVGDIGPGPGIPSTATPLIEHWNGKNWTEAKFPEPADGGQFTGVAAISARNVWVVGHTGEVSEGSGQATLIEHWNGRKWAIVRSPNATGSANSLNDVAASSAHNAWAVGGTVSPAGQYRSLVEHWNGTKWTIVSSPSPTGDTNLEGVAVASASDAWAVGITRPTSCDPQCGSAALRWNGKRWTVAPSVNPSANYLNVLFGVAIISASNVWAVGSTDYASTLIEHWNGKEWTWHLPS
jgi:hypothetical protein